jgi:hypothetical protein
MANRDQLDVILTADDVLDADGRCGVPWAPFKRFKTREERYVA